MANAIINRVSRFAIADAVRYIARATLLACVVVPLMQPVIAKADDWGCQVLLCLADPRGPEAEGACVPPIEKLWDALSHGHPFPTCDLSSSTSDLPPDVKSLLPPSALSAGQGTGATNVGAGPGYCRPDLLYWGPPEQSVLSCSARGAINVTIDNALFTRVWWGTNGNSGSITEYYGQGSTAVPYDPATAAQQFLNPQSTVTPGVLSDTHAGGGDH
jgi:hypothetical protein